MKTVVITGSARGLGFEMAKCFRKNNFNVVISDINNDEISRAVKKLKDVKGKGNLEGIVCDITSDEQIINLIQEVSRKFNNINIWVNNAGINQPDKMIWELSGDEIDKMIDVDLKGTIKVSKYVMEKMIKQKYGAIYTVEGHGSNDAVIPGLSVYGTAKRGLTYFLSALAKEAEVSKLDIMIGKLSPGIMITDFLVNSFSDKKIELSDKNKKIYNILGDYPDVVAKFLVNKMINNTNNNVRFCWLTNRKAVWKFVTALFKKRNFFETK